MRQHIDMDRRELRIIVKFNLEDKADADAARSLLRALGLLEENLFQAELVRTLTPAPPQEARKRKAST